MMREREIVGMVGVGGGGIGIEWFMDNFYLDQVYLVRCY